MAPIINQENISIKIPFHLFCDCSGCYLQTIDDDFHQGYIICLGCAHFKKIDFFKLFNEQMKEVRISPLEKIYFLLTIFSTDIEESDKPESYKEEMLTKILECQEFLKKELGWDW